MNAPTPYRDGDLYACTCGTTVVRYGRTIYDWSTGGVHECDRTLDGWLDAITADALEGSEDAATMLPSVVNAWLLSR